MRESAFGGRRTPSAVRLWRCGGKAKSTDTRQNRIQFSGVGVRAAAEREAERAKGGRHASSRRCNQVGRPPLPSVERRIQERDVKGYVAADDSAEATADWVARIPMRADCRETQFPPVGMELGVSRYDTRVAAGQGSTYARIPTTPRAMGSQ
ncbi:hypothetical protein AXG93_1207s1010 [Marchantia polymorpha subsp. ruderalis]|uniref:Uncharacterized protein n=1 Tax=Marchantia polymorpha subsp. ruderalis TaxID=1480154 RepID=A0A176VHX2_MARPO|nr:hypothetical protein AXG93_1207s1010 [Marchantia polymorpha subsp. ruderalis]